MGIAVLRPDVNESDTDFTVSSRSDAATKPAQARQEGDPLRPRRGQGRRRGRGRGRSSSAREQGGPFLSLFDFCERVDARKVNRKVLEALVKAGAFDGIAAQNGVSRAAHVRRDRRRASSARPRRSASARAARPRCSRCSPARGGNGGRGVSRRGRVPRRRGVDAQGAARLREGEPRLLHQRPPARPLRRRAAPLHHRDHRQLHGEGRARRGDPGGRGQCRYQERPHEERHGEDTPSSTWRTRPGRSSSS